MKKKTKKNNNKNKLIIILLGIIFIVLITMIYLFTRQPDDSIDWTGEMGEVIVEEVEEDIETLPGNIIDNFGLEYEYTRIPSLGFETYVPAGWSILYENDYIYFIAPEDDENYKYTEIAFCVTDVDALSNIKNTASLLMLSDYTQKNLRYHSHNIPFVISTVSNNSYTEVYDMDKPRYITKTSDSYTEYETIPDTALTENSATMLEGYHFVGYYCSPKPVFVHASDPMISNVQTYSVFYQLYMAGRDTTVFTAINAPLSREDRVEEIGKTIAFNTNPYTNSKYDYKYSYESVKLKRIKIGGIEFSTKDMEDVEESAQSTVYVANLSTDPKNLAFNSYLIARNHGQVEDYTELVNDDFMFATLSMTNDTIDTLSKKYASNQVTTRPTYTKSVSYIPMLTKEVMRVEWSANIAYGTDARKYVNAIMPAKFCTYVIPDGDNAYSITISYTTYQKYQALKYIEKLMSATKLE